MAEPVKDGAATAEEATRRDAAVPRVRRGFLWALAGTAAVFIYLVHANWFLVGYPYMARAQAWLQERAQERVFARGLKQDPPLGARLPDVLMNQRAASVSERADGRKAVSQGQIIVFGGPLSACCTRESVDVARGLPAKLRQQTAGQAVEVVLVLQASASAVREYAASQRWNFTVVADEEGSLARAYNAFWTPRVYGLVGGRLRWIQKGKQVNEQELAQAVSQGRGVASRPVPHDGGSEKP